MIVFFSTLAIVSLLLVVYNSSGIAKDIKRTVYFLITATLIFVAGFRYYVGTDYAQYVFNYDRYLQSDFTLLSQSALGIVARIAKWMYDDYATWFFLMSVITITPIMHTIQKESECIWLSVIMYILLCSWHSAFNTVKQGAATAIIFVGYPYLRDRNFSKWCIICLIASAFHVTALLMIPVFFLVNASITRKRTLFIVCIGFMVRISYDGLYDIVALLKQGASLVNQESDIWQNSVNVLRIAVHCIPILIYLVFEKIYNQDDNFSCLYNMSLLNAVLNISTMNSIYLNRFCGYTNIFNVLFIPLLFQPIKRKRSAFWILPMALIFYCVFWAYDLYKCSDTVNFYWIFER